MVDFLSSDFGIWISDIGCGYTRTALLGLEPGSRIWLQIEGRALLFERLQDGPDGRSMRGLRAVDPTADCWHRLYNQRGAEMLELQLTERPADLGKAAVCFTDNSLL